MATDKIVSALALFSFVSGAVIGGGIVIYQIGHWLMYGLWHSLPLGTIAGFLRYIGSDWVGLQIVWDWILKLPLSLVVFLLGFVLFWRLGLLSAKIYKAEAEKRGAVPTAAQIQA